MFEAEERREGRRQNVNEEKEDRKKEKEEGKVKKKSAQGARRVSARDQIRSRRELGRCGCVVNETWIAGGEHPLRFTPQFLSNHAATACASPLRAASATSTGSPSSAWLAWARVKVRGYRGRGAVGVSG